MTNPHPLAGRPLHVSGRLSVEIDDQTVSVVAEGDRVVVDLPGVGVLKTILRGSGEKSQLNQMTALLQGHDIEVVVQLKGQVIATLGKSAEPGTLEKMFNLHGVDVKFRDLAKALFKRGID